MIKNVTINNEVEYFSREEFSHSKLTQINANPEWMLYPDVLESEASYESTGTMVHSYILEPDEFDKTYAFFDGNTPSSKQQQGYAALVASGKSSEDAYSFIYKTEGKSANEIKKAVKKLNFELHDYIQIKQEKPSAILIKQDKKFILTEIKNSLIRNKHTNKILFELNGINENIFFGEYGKYKTKAKVDRVAYNKKEKIIYVTDFKTMSLRNKKVNIIRDIKSRMENFNYYRQLAYYGLFIRDYHKDLIAEGWTIKHVIIFVTIDIPFNVRIYEIKNDNIYKKYREIINIFSNISVHEELGYTQSVEYHWSEKIPKI